MSSKQTELFPIYDKKLQGSILANLYQYDKKTYLAATILLFTGALSKELQDITVEDAKSGTFTSKAGYNFSFTHSDIIVSVTKMLIKDAIAVDSKFLFYDPYAPQKQPSREYIFKLFKEVSGSKITLHTEILPIVLRKTFFYNYLLTHGKEPYHIASKKRMAEFLCLSGKELEELLVQVKNNNSKETAIPNKELIEQLSLIENKIKMYKEILKKVPDLQFENKNAYEFIGEEIGKVEKATGSVEDTLFSIDRIYTKK